MIPALIVTAHLIVEPAAIAAFLAERGHTPEQIARQEFHAADGSPVTIEEVQAAILATDPVSFCEANLINRPEEGGGDWRLYEFQKPSMRFRGPVVHEDAAEVGKTREIIGLAWWGCTMRTGSSLIASAQDGNLDVLWRNLEYQMDQNAWLARQVKRKNVKPYKEMEFHNGNTLYLRPAGTDGEAMRSIHVSQFEFFDEIAKVHNPDALSEFNRAGREGCEQRLYSVPDGRRSSPFYKRCERAIPYRAGMAPPTDGRFVKFHWPKTLLPNWSRELENALIELYGGRDTPGYARNVLGLWGDPADSVFPWSTLAPCLHYVPEYVVLKILWDGSTSTFYVEAHKLTKGYQIRSGSTIEDTTSGGVAPLTEIYRGDFPAKGFDIAKVLRERIGTVDAAHLVAGVDVGCSLQEPTEIFISALGETDTLVKRIQLRNMASPIQEDAIRALDAIFRPDHGWGMDATGQGLIVEQHLRSHASGWRFEDRLSGFVANVKVDYVDPETGEKPDDEEGRSPSDPGYKPRRISCKELSIVAMERGLYKGRKSLPYDPDIVRDMTSFTATKAKNGDREYSTTNEHTITADAMLSLRRLEVLRGGLADAPIEYAVPEGAARMNLTQEGL